MSDTELKSCMTLDEAIEHCKEKADCTKCGMEHQQLAEWLIELKSRRNAMERIVEQIVEQKQIVAKMKELFALNQKMNQELLQAKKYASQLMESVLQEAFSVQETEKPSQVIEFYSNQTTSETELLAAARGKIREDTWEHLCKRALEIAGEEC
ncbi:MAG: hypothetical protein ACLS9Q_08340 [[Clostridium] scindens]|uniref:hypothetical protein n=1 Tax=Clostridium scindens (strain JCM 10418 / VPI 12708) TaxID=29347 RepID=UPI0039969F61